MLRFLAASMVLFTHATFYVSTRIDNSVSVLDWAGHGVAIFFVISGFIMALTSQPLATRENGYMHFIKRRLIRIVPLYWTVNVIKIILLFVIPSSIFANPDISNIILSLLFIPSHNAAGAIETFYGVGWTLNFEMFFYAIFALALFFCVRISLFVSVILVLTASFSLLRQDYWPAVSFLLNPIVLNFLWGVLIAELVIRNMHVPNTISWLLICTGIVALLLPPPVNTYGIQYAALVAGIVLLEPELGDRIPNFLVFGGNASYSLYLIHPLIGAAIATILAKFEVISASWSIAVIIIFSLVAASFVYSTYERPLVTYLKSRFSS
ncbi:acyltransferase family protein [Thermodesulfobacteriota bacterium]